MEYIVLAFALGYISYPFFEALKAIIINTWNATYTSGCTGDCNQCRNCTCKNKIEG